MCQQLEQVTGPVRGYFIAAYAGPASRSSREWVSYFKVCTVRPESYFDDGVILHKGSPAPTADDAGAALEMAIREATDLVSEWPPARELPAYRQARPLFFWEAAELGLL